MPTDTFAITTDNDDGTGYRGGGTNWANISTDPFTAEETTTLLVSQVTNGTQFFLDNTFLRFDTSSLPDNAVPSSANLLLYLIAKGTNPDNIVWGADFYDFGGEPSVAADWELSTSGDAITSFTSGSLTASAVNTIALTGLSGINKTGFTGIRIAPTGSVGQPTSSLNTIEFAASESVQQEPRLEVTYEIVGDTTTRRYQIRRSRGTSW